MNQSIGIGSFKRINSIIDQNAKKKKKKKSLKEFSKKKFSVVYF